MSQNWLPPPFVVDWTHSALTDVTLEMKPVPKLSAAKIFPDRKHPISIRINNLFFISIFLLLLCFDRGSFFFREHSFEPHSQRGFAISPSFYGENRGPRYWTLGY